MWVTTPHRIKVDVNSQQPVCGIFAYILECLHYLLYILLYFLYYLLLYCSALPSSTQCAWHYLDCEADNRLPGRIAHDQVVPPSILPEFAGSPFHSWSELHQRLLQLQP